MDQIIMPMSEIIPIKYTDRDERFVWVILFLAVSFGAAGYTATCITAEGSLIGGVLGVIVYQDAQKLDLAANRETEESTDESLVSVLIESGAKIQIDLLKKVKNEPIILSLLSKAFEKQTVNEG